MPSAFDFIRLPVPCPHCGKESLQWLTDLVASDEVTCGFCQGTVEVGSKEWRSFIDEAAQLYKTIGRV